MKNYEGMPRGGWTERAIVQYEDMEPEQQAKVGAMMERGMSPVEAVRAVLKEQS